MMIEHGFDTNATLIDARIMQLLSIRLSIDPGIIRHREGELRQITLSVNDLLISCRTSYSPSVA
jgi:hypothetical protein